MLTLKHQVKRQYDVMVYEYTEYEKIHTEMQGKLIGQLIGAVPRDKILDLGCGAGRLSRYISRMFGSSVVGIDFSATQVKAAYSLSKAGGYRCDFLVGDAERLPFRGKSFDCSICVGLLQSVEDPTPILVEVERITSKKMLFTYDNAHSIPNLVYDFLATLIRKEFLESPYTRKKVFKKFKLPRWRTHVTPITLFNPRRLKILRRILDTLILRGMVKNKRDDVVNRIAHALDIMVKKIRLSLLISPNYAAILMSDINETYSIKRPLE